ncbi:MAG: WYL domain-containing protein [Rhodopirellula sp.]|nr:WYL domain-containing protein [Rhodopirellula sp.]
MAKKKQPKALRPDADRRVRQADRLARVLKVLELIQGNARWDAAALSVELGCSERTVRRYLDVLEFAGIPFWFDRERRCYRVRHDFKFPVLNLTEEELVSQAVATAVTAAPGLDAGGSSGATTRKLAAVSDERARKVLDEVWRLVQVLDLKLTDHSRHRDVIRTILWGLLKHKQIAGQYESPYYERPMRLTLHPYRLCLVRQAWYVIGRSVKDAVPKTYRAARFKTLRILDADSDVPKEFSLDKYFGNAWGVFRSGKEYNVEIRFTKDAAIQVTETQWHHTQEVERRPDGSVTLRFRVDGLDEILWWLLGWTGFVEVVRPKELRHMLVDQLTMGMQLNEPQW